MNRRTFMTRASVAAIAAGVTPLMLQAAGTKPHRLVHSKPNIVMILADDVSSDMFSCYKQPGTAKTPNIDQIAREGVVFQTCFAPAMCGPSRALLMTGVYGNRTGAYRNDIWVDGARKSIYKEYHSWGKLMQQGGYKTAIASKWHAGAQMPYEKEVGFDEYCLWEGPSKIKEHTGIDIYAEGLRKKTKQTDSRYWHPCYLRNDKYVPVKETDFGPDISAAFISDFIERKTKAKEPFVAYWPTAIPHGPTVTTPDRIGPTETFGILPKPNVKGLSKDEKEKALKDYKEESDKRFIAMIEYLDKLIGKLIQKTKDLGIYENTYFIFCGDNGTAVTAKDRGVERGVHVPFVVKGPEVKQLGMTEELTDFSDIAPTLLDMAGIAHPTDISYDGKSQMPFLTGKTSTHRDWIYGYIGPVQVFRLKNYLLEARSSFYGKPEGRFYYTGKNRFGRGYVRIDKDPKHANAVNKLKKIAESLPNHLDPDHLFWKSSAGQAWIEKNKDLKSKHLYNHPDYQFYDEED